MRICGLCGRGRAGRCRPAFSAPARSPLAAWPSRPSRPIGRKKNTPSTPVAAARLFAKRPNPFVGVLCLPWVFAPLRCAHIVSLCPCPPRRFAPAPPSLPSVAARGLCVRPRWVGECMPLLLPSLRSGRGVRSSPRSAPRKASRVRGLMSLSPRPFSPLGVGMVLVSVCLGVPFCVHRPSVVCISGLSIAKRKRLCDRLAPRVCCLHRP